MGDSEPYMREQLKPKLKLRIFLLLQIYPEGANFYLKRILSRT